MNTINYKEIIDLLNHLKKYYSHLSTACKKIHEEHHIRQQHLKLNGKEPAQQLINELKELQKNIKKIPLTTTLHEILNNGMELLTIHLKKNTKNADTVFVRLITTPLKKELLRIYTAQPDKTQWILAGYEIFEK